MTALVLTWHPGDLVRIRGEQWRIARHLPYHNAAIVEVTGSGSANRGDRARFLLPFEPLDRLAVPTLPRVVRPARWRRVARRALADAVPSASSLRAATRATLTLIPFQLEPALALARGDGCRFLIADAVGMGKTVQAGLMIAELAQRLSDCRVLVVAPAGLRDQWRDELHSRFGLDAEVLDAAGVARTAARLPAGMNPWAVHPLVITSIDYVKRPEVLRCHEALIWDLVVFDEAHGLTGRSDRAAAGEALGCRARTLVMLTATPHSGDDEAFRQLCRIGDVGDRAPLLVFRRARADLGLSRSRRTVLLRVRPTPAEMGMHEALIEYARRIWAQRDASAGAGARLAISVLLRRACSSPGSLARSVERRMLLLAKVESAGGEALEGRHGQPSLPFSDPADDDEPHTLLTAVGLRDPADEHARLARILDLAREASGAESKLAVLCRLVARAREPAIVFTEYRDTLQRIAAALPGDAVHLHGGLGSHERREALRRFASGDARLLLATDAASEGLNLHQRCRLVVNLELPWTPLRLEQRAGRVDRIGQLRRVHAIHLVAAQTSEDSVLAKLAARTRRMHAAFNDINSQPPRNPTPKVASCAPRQCSGHPEHESKGRNGEFRIPPDERRIADWVVTGHALTLVNAIPPSPTLPDAVATDSGADARSEAARIAEARALLPPGDESIPESRPVITRLRRRSAARSRPRTFAPSGGSRCFWLFRLLFTAPDGRVLHESIVPVGGCPTRLPAPSPVHTSMLLDPHHHPAVQQAAAAAQDAQLYALRLALRQLAQLWGRRERAIAELLRARHARLSAGLLQPGLFDRRNERAASAQSVLLASALSDSATRLRTLAGYDGAQVESCDLVCAIAIE